MIKNKIDVVAIIPCKMDSIRLKDKNISIINNKTLLEHTIEYAQQSRYVNTIIVSTESEEVEEICRKYPEVLIHERPEHLLKDADTVDVYVDVVKKIDNEKITHVVGLQVDNPDRSSKLDSILEYFVNKKYDDLVTVDKDGTRNGSVRVIKAEFVKADNVSRRVGSIRDICTNIHTQQDLEIARNNMKNNI